VTTTKRKKTKTAKKSKKIVRSDYLTLEQIQERLTDTMLASGLALKVLKNIRKPTSQLIEELLDIEFQVGHFVGKSMKMHTAQMIAPNLRGALANVLSTVPLNGQRIPDPPHKELSERPQRSGKLKRKNTAKKR
jgi:hypothetical protein